MTFVIMMKILNQNVRGQKNKEKLELSIGIETHHDRTFVRHTEWDSIS